MKLIKKVYLIIIYMCFLFILYYLYFSCYAGVMDTVYLNANKNIVEKDEEIEVIMYIENEKVAAFNSYIFFDNTKLEYVSGPENTNVVNNKIISIWYDIEGGNNPKEGEIARYIFRAKEEGIVTFNVDGKFYDSMGQLIDTNFQETQVQIGKEQIELEKVDEDDKRGTKQQTNNAKLQDLKLDIEGLIPKFDSNINNYYLTLSDEINNIEIFAVSENSNALVKVTGNTNLKDGLNIITIQVTAEDETQSNIYAIEVTKTKNLEQANTNLEILAIENVLLNPRFDNGVTHYSIECSNNIEALNIFAVPENENAKAQIIGNEMLKEGDNLIKVIVTAENGFSEKVFEIQCYKRNIEEENVYEENKKANIEKLQQIYKAEKTSVVDENYEIDEKEDENQRQSLNIILLIILIVLLISIFVIKYKKKKTHMS